MWTNSIGVISPACTSSKSRPNRQRSRSWNGPFTFCQGIRGFNLQLTILVLPNEYGCCHGRWAHNAEQNAWMWGPLCARYRGFMMYAKSACTFRCSTPMTNVLLHGHVYLQRTLDIQDVNFTGQRYQTDWLKFCLTYQNFQWYLSIVAVYVAIPMVAVPDGHGIWENAKYATWKIIFSKSLAYHQARGRISALESGVIMKMALIGDCCMCSLNMMKQRILWKTFVHILYLESVGTRTATTMKDAGNFAWICLCNHPLFSVTILKNNTARMSNHSSA